MRQEGTARGYAGAPTVGVRGGHALAAFGQGLRLLARRHWAALAVFLLFALSALVVPVMIGAPVGDDWVYARSVEILIAEGELRIIDLSVVTLVFQVAWGALFAAIFGPSFGVLRLSTLALMALGGLALYGLCRELRVGRARSALGLAVYLFHPLSFVLGFSFMSDPQFTALLVIAAYWYARGLRPGPVGERAQLIGAAAAACAFLVRQQGALIPLAVVVYFALCRRPQTLAGGIALVARVAALPALATLLYYGWLRYIHGIPFRQRDFINSVTAAGWPGTRDLVQQLLIIAALYLGFFALPLAIAVFPRLRRLAGFEAAPGWLLFCGWVAVVAAGIGAFGTQGRLMPYSPQFVAPWGLGPNDLQGDRPALVDADALWWFTAACAGASLVLGLALCRRAVAAAPTPDRARAGLALAVAAWQAVGILPASYSFIQWGGTLDRYLLPLLPFALCLGLWATRDVRLATPAAWVVVVALGLVAVAGTRDFLVFQGATWEFAARANALGIPNTRLDAGTSWDGYHLYEYSQANRIPPQTPDGPWWPGRPWWTGLFAPATDSSYVISSTPLPDFAIVERATYSSWLHRAELPLYLLRRPDVAGPP
jgi:hypothetical protein